MTDATVRPPGPGLGPRTVARQARTVLGRTTTPVTELFEAATRRYGDLVHLRFGTEHVYLAANPDLVRDVLVTHGRITHKGRGLENARLLLGNGLLTAEDAEHLRNRRLVSPAFNHSHVAGYARTMRDEALVQHEAWSLLTGPPRVDMAEEMAALTLRIAGSTLFSTDMGDRTRVVGEALQTALATFERFQVPGGDVLLRLPTPWRGRLRAATRSLDAVVADLVAEHRADPEAFRGDVLSVLLESRDEDGTGLSDEQVRDEVLTLLLAGHETTANLLTWAWHLLGRDAGAERRLHDEVDALGRPPEPEDAFGAALPFARAVVAETLRLYPPAWTVGRRYTAPATLPLGGTAVAVPVRTIAVTSQWVLHRDPRWWGPDAAEFRPQRWLVGSGPRDWRFDDAAPGQPRWAYFPFGGGRRVCLGEHFAWTEAVLVLATLARHWAPRPSRPGPVAVRPSVTLRPRDGLPMLLVRR